MTSPESDAEIDIRGTQIETLEAFVVREPTQAKLLKPDYRALLDLVESSPSANGLSDTRRAKILYDAFGAVVAKAHAEAPKDGKFTKLTPSETGATYVAAAGELLGLASDNELLARCGEDRYEKCLADGEKATDLDRRKFRAVAWVGLGSTRSAERRAKEDWWPAFLAAVERHLDQRLKNVPPKAAAAPAQELIVEPPEPDQVQPDDSFQQKSNKSQTISALRKMVAALIVCAFIAIPFWLIAHMPMTTWWPLNLADAVAPWFTVLCVALWSVSSTVPRVAQLRRPHPRSLRLISVLVGTLAMTLVVGSHMMRYQTETAYARSIEARAGNGTIVYTNDFDQEISCPPGDPRTARNRLPLASCTESNGSLRATMVAILQTAIGVYPTGVGEFFTDPYPPSPPTYYIETRFRTVDGAPLSACGISIQASIYHPSFYRDQYQDASLLFHLRQPSAKDSSYKSEVLALHAAGDSASDMFNIIVPTIFASSPTPLDFVNRAVIPAWANGTWTKFGIVVTGSTFTFLVNDRVVMIVSESGFNSILPSVAVLAGSKQSGGTATCDFDYLHIRQLSS